jgi:hypothetical protein
LCAERLLAVCDACLIVPGRLGSVDHKMPGGQTICAHRRKDALARKFGAGDSVLYQVGN